MRLVHNLILTVLCLSVTATQADTVAVPYTVKKEGQVSLAVYDQQGRLVRTLLTGAPRRPGQYAEAWDGCDRYGNRQPPGKYTWKLLETKGLTAKFLLQVGQNPIPKDAFGIGNHGAPGSVVADETGVYFAALAEGAHILGKTDRAGKYIYAQSPHAINWGAHRGIALTLLEGKLYDLCGDGLVYGFDAATGNCFTDWDAPKPWNLNWPGTTNKVTGVMDLAADPTNKLLVVSYRDHNALRWFDPAQKGAAVDEVTGFDQPTGIAVKADGTVLVIMKGAVWAVTSRARPPGAPSPDTNSTPAARPAVAPYPLISADKLQSPWRLDVNRQTGEILVAENSEAAGGALPLLAGGVAAKSTEPRHHQVKKFSATGELLATYGKPEGRRDGPYIASDFRNINDVSFDPLGGFFVSEGPWTPPRRTVRLDDTGKALHEWFGGQAWGTLCVPEPGDPAHVWFYCNAPVASGLVRCEIDFEAARRGFAAGEQRAASRQTRLPTPPSARPQVSQSNGDLRSAEVRGQETGAQPRATWKVVETYWDVFLDNALGNIAPNYLEITRHGGKLYVYTGTPFCLSITVYDPLMKTLRPSNHSQVQRNLPREFVPADYRGDWDSYIWNDLNDDGQTTANELVWMHRAMVGGYIDPADFTLYLVGQASAFYDGFKITPRRFTAGGTPVYDWADAKPHPSQWKEDDGAVSIGDLRHNPDGTWLGCFAATIRTAFEGWEAHGQWYYNTCSGIDRLVKWDKNWQPLWSVGRHSPDRDHEVGSTAMARFLGGTTHGCVVWADNSDEETAGPTVWTDDGLYVDEFWRLHGNTASEEVYGIGTVNEFASGRLCTDPRTGRVYFYMVTASLGSTVYEIHGWDGWRRARGTVELKRETPAPIAFTGTGLKAEYFNNLDLTGSPALTRVDGPVYLLWCTNAVAAGVNADNFSVRWTGQVQAQTTEPYKFTVETIKYWLCDGLAKFIRIWVDGRQVDDQWILLKAGQKYDIRVEAGWAEGNAVAKLCWETKTNDRRVIIPKYLYPSAGGGSSVPPGSTRSLWYRTKRDRGEWHHLVEVNGGPHEDSRIYVDGVLRAVSPSFGVPPSGGILASPPEGGTPNHGETRDAKTFDRALHILEIKDLYRREVGLLAHVPFDDKRGIHPACRGAIPGIVVNIVGDTEWTDGALTTKPNGPFQPSYIMIGNQLELPATDYTIAFRFKTTAADGLLFCAHRRSPYNANWQDHHIGLGEGKLGFSIIGQDAIRTPGKLNDGQWHHVVTTVGGATKDSRLYVDGKLIGTGNLAVRQQQTNRLGANLGGAAASFADFRCYGQALNENEVRSQAY